MSTEQTSVAAIEWTVIKTVTDKAGNSKQVEKALYRSLDLSPELTKERETWLAAAEAANKLRAAMDAKIKASLAKSAFGKAVPEGYELVIAHKYGPAFTALPAKTKAAKRNAVKVAA